MPPHLAAVETSLMWDSFYSFSSFHVSCYFERRQMKLVIFFFFLVSILISLVLDPVIVKYSTHFSEKGKDSD